MTTKETAWAKVERDVVAGPEPAPRPPQAILHDWVMGLGLRLQGVLMSAVRGCDTVQRHDHSKVLVRIYRCEILRTQTGDPTTSKSFILAADVPKTRELMGQFLNDCDHLPQHYVMHFLHAAEILGYCHPDLERRDLWQSFYTTACRKYHVRPESYTELLDRLEKNEDDFHKAQDTSVEARLYEDNKKEKVKKEAEARAEERRRYGEYGGS